MPWNDAMHLLSVALLVVAMLAVHLSGKPALQKTAHLLWAVAIICITVALAYLVTAQALNWF